MREFLFVLLGFGLGFLTVALLVTVSIMSLPAPHNPPPGHGKVPRD